MLRTLISKSLSRAVVAPEWEKMGISKTISFDRVPRKRTMPFIPEPFHKISPAKSSHEWNVFSPDHNVSLFKKTLNEREETILHNKAASLAWRAVGVHYYTPSEFYWEMCAWHDIFGSIHNDDDLRIDKRPYKYVETEPMGKLTVKTRIPDATFGIKSFIESCNENGYPAYRKDAKKEPDPRLLQSRLNSLTRNPNCGLIMDGMWEESGMIFPFAVYEAKKGKSWNVTGEEQVYHACKTYLAMLDDLARNPENVTEYQTKESSQFQMFAFTSIGSYWQVYVAWSSLNKCMVESVWGGDICKYSNALELIHIVNQIHKFAINRHLPFVLKHLEAWYAWEKKQPISCDTEEQPPWLNLIEAAKKERLEKSQETRKRNRKRPDTGTDMERKVKRRRAS